MARLVDVDRVLALFAEGIAGRPYHIKSRGEYKGEDAAERTRSGLGGGARHDARSIYLADTIDDFADDALNQAIYRLEVLVQVGFREFGTYRFNIDVARQRVPGLPMAKAASDRESDFGLFFGSFTHPEVARALFRAVETARVQAAVVRRYPGARRYRQALIDHRNASYAGTFDTGVLAEVERLEAALDGLAAADSPLFPLAVDVLGPDADVYTSARAAQHCYEALRLSEQEKVATTPADGEPSLEWLQREARLEDWDEELKNVEGDIAALEFAELASGDEVRVGDAEGDAGEPREIGTDLVVERDQLKRRIEMERSSVRRALGEEGDHEGTTSYRYDEWDFHNGAYLRGWCRLYEERLHGGDADTQALLDTVRPFARAVRRRFEEVRPAGYQRVKKTPDGDELDIDTLVDTRVDIRSGMSPDERVYSRRERLRRDVAAAFLVDLSASTDDVLPEEREEHVPDGRSQDIRDPFFDEDDAYPGGSEYNFAERMAAEAAKRRIVDILRESVLLMATALEGLGDRYGVYGFSGYGRDCVEFYVAKEFDQPFDGEVLDAIAAMKPKRSTRMGPAVRHAAAKLEASGSAMKVLMIISDGFPQDHDYGPDRGQHEYGVQDTAQALIEAQGQGIETFCVTVDRSGNDYLRRMCPDDRYMVIDETAELPDALQKAYRQLTRA